jgi:hypothetical protein
MFNKDSDVEYIGSYLSGKSPSASDFPLWESNWVTNPAPEFTPVVNRKRKTDIVDDEDISPSQSLEARCVSLAVPSPRLAAPSIPPVFPSLPSAAGFDLGVAAAESTDTPQVLSSLPSVADFDLGVLPSVSQYNSGVTNASAVLSSQPSAAEYSLGVSVLPTTPAGPYSTVSNISIGEDGSTLLVNLANGTALQYDVSGASFINFVFQDVQRLIDDTSWINTEDL